MLTRIRAHLTYANVVASLALFVALGGGAYAATQLPKNSVGSAQLKKHAVTPQKVSLKTIKLFKGDRGPAGATNVTARTVTGSIPVTCTPSPIFPGSFQCGGSGTVHAPCRRGEKATGGSYATNTSSGPETVSDDGPDPATGTPTGWYATGSVSNMVSPSSFSSAPLTVHVVCAAP